MPPQRGDRVASCKSDECTQLLLSAQKGDAQAFASLYAALRPITFDFLAATNARLSPHERDDLVQDVFLAVWQNLLRYRGDASAKTFVLAIAKRLALKALAKRQRFPVASVSDLSGISDLEPPPSQSRDRENIVAMLEEAMARLPAAQREAMELHLRGLPRAEARRLANCGPNQFQKRLQRATQSLRRLLRRLPDFILI